MGLILKLLVSTLGGFALHWFHNPTKQFGPKWGTILRYVIGWIGALPFLLLILPDEKREEVMEAYMLTGCSLGLGVFIGYVVTNDDD